MDGGGGRGWFSQLIKQTKAKDICYCQSEETATTGANLS